MATYGNSGGRNRGKRYIKLTGGETATPENETRAHDFMAWYGANICDLRRGLYNGFCDADLMSETALHIYDCIAFKGLRIDNYRSYYLRAYHTNRIAAIKRDGENLSRTIRIDNGGLGGNPNRIEARVVPRFPDGDRKAYEVAAARLETEILEYVRGKYDAAAVALFEIYVALRPDISYKRLSELLGWPLCKIWPIMGAIRKDVAARFGERHRRLLTIYG